MQTTVEKLAAWAFIGALVFVSACVVAFVVYHTPVLLRAFDRVCDHLQYGTPLRKRVKR